MIFPLEDNFDEVTISTTDYSHLDAENRVALQVNYYENQRVKGRIRSCGLFRIFTYMNYALI